MKPPSNALKTWLAQLKSPQPSARERSIKELELLGDPAALPALAEIFATDPEPALRALAQAAGKSIYYGAIRQRLISTMATEEERRRAAEALVEAQTRKRSTSESRKVEE